MYRVIFIDLTCGMWRVKTEAFDVCCKKSDWQDAIKNFA